MSERIDITQMEPGVYGVQVTEGTTRTSHRVSLGDTLSVIDLTQDEESRERLIRESIKFLLECEPNSAILPEFSLDDIAKYFPEFRDEIVERIS